LAHLLLHDTQPDPHVKAKEPSAFALSLKYLKDTDLDFLTLTIQ
jgi:hypothetical protein